MINFTKKQIKAIIDVLKSEPCKSRPALQTMRIKRDGYCYITNGYFAIRYKFDLEPIPRDDSQEEFVITLDNLIKWYKLASTKDYLNELTILDLQDKENDTQYPNVDYFFKDKLSIKSDSGIININGKLLAQIIDCVGEYEITISHYRDLIYIQFFEQPVDAILMEINR